MVDKPGSRSATVYSTNQLRKCHRMTDQLSRVFAALADPTRRDMVARLTVGRRHRRRPRGAVRRQRPGGLQAPQGARGGRPGQPQPGGPAAAGAPGGGGVRPDDQVDRALPAAGRGALPAPRRACSPSSTTRQPDHGQRRTRGRNSIMSTSTSPQATIEADPDVPMIRITREFAATPDAGLPGAHRPRPVRPVGRPGRHDARRSTTGTPATAARGGSSASATTRSTPSAAASTP